MIHKIALTGGPCGGKSTALPVLTNHFKKQGFQVLTSPEVATMLYTSGVQLRLEPEEYHWDLELAAFRIQHSIEEALWNLAEHHDNDSIIISDRGLIDLKAYSTPLIWQHLLFDVNRSETAILRDYDAVVHLVTAAIGAEKYFTNENNPARNCTLDLAKMLDRKTFEAWNGHHNRIEIDNSTDFDGKMKRTIDAIERTISASRTSLP